jgi:hypothetical protein
MNTTIELGVSVKRFLNLLMLLIVISRRGLESMRKSKIKSKRHVLGSLIQRRYK